ncbi:CRISPR-associated Cas2 family protein [Leucobacter luti]|uniref:CRISPR-associated Cas2 family protein n=1 Tax=Leucobacter luti TaxID=340320 RepID=A0A4R6S1Q7_9MICO|nr:type I-E CRISPR-associated endoribonuclease Cas2e [Leucobacter luti]TDP92575.1 CRISPR-associated Cas2 family protein [Leucobacter luti]
MIVIVLSACPPGLRGYLTRWLLEISAGVFVGKVSKKVRLLLWEACVTMVGNGRAILVHQAKNEQGLGFLVHGHHWEPIDMDGIRLMLRPDLGARAGSTTPQFTPPTQALGWSKASRRRKFG